LSANCGFTVALLSRPLSLTVPASGSVVTEPVTMLPIIGTTSWIDCLMPSAGQVMVPSRDPMVPAGS